MAIVKLKTSDGVVFETNTEILKCFGAMESLLANLDTGNEETLIQISNVSSKIMGLVLEWAEHYQKSLNEPSVDEPITADNETPENKGPADGGPNGGSNGSPDGNKNGAPVNEPIVGVKSAVIENAVTDYNQMAVDDPNAEGEKKVEDENVLPIVEADPKPNTYKEWEQGFLNTDKGILFDIILMASCLDIKPLMDVACDKVASYFVRRSTEETLRYFNISNGNGKDK